MKRNLLFVTILGIFILSMWSIPQSASITLQEEGDDDESHERSVQVEYDESQLRFQSELKNGTSKDVIIAEVDVESNYPDDSVSGQTEIRFKYKQENALETQFSYRVELLNLVEYVENGTEWGYQPNEHVADYSVGGTGWHPIAYSFDNSTGGEVHIFNITTADDVVSIIIRVSGKVFNMGNATLTPNTMKMDIIINNFPYSTGSSSLAFLAKVKSTVQVHANDDTIEEGQGTGANETELQLNVNGTTGFFSWAETAEIDGQTTNVITSPVMVNTTDDDLNEGEHSNDMYFSFNATDAASIIWDPKLGVVTNDYTPEAPISSDPVSEDPSVSEDPTSQPESPSPSNDGRESSDGVNSTLPILNFYIISTVFVLVAGILRKKHNH